jgi:hypothetical protein
MKVVPNRVTGVGEVHMSAQDLPVLTREVVNKTVGVINKS